MNHINIEYGKLFEEKIKLLTGASALQLEQYDYLNSSFLGYSIFENINDEEIIDMAKAILNPANTNVILASIAFPYKNFKVYVF